MSEPKPQRDVWGFTVYAYSMEDAEKLRTLVVDALQANQQIAVQTEQEFPEWDIDSDSCKYGPEDES